MKVGIVADSHDNLPMIRKAVAKLSAAGAETLVHAGDFIAPFAVKEILKFPGRVLGVFGNNDGERAGISKIWREVAEPPGSIKLGGRTILIVHSLDQAEEADLKHADVLIHAHTHKPSIESGKPLKINPGELCGWLYGRATAAVLDTKTLEVEIIDVT